MHNSQPHVRPRRLESIRVIIAENGESESYGVEDGGLFMEMVVTNEMISEKEKLRNKASVQKKEKIFGFVLTWVDLIGGFLFFFFGRCATYLSATCRI